MAIWKMLRRLQLNVCLSKSKLPGSTRIAVTCQERQRFICLLLVLAHFDGLAQPTSTRKLGKSGGKGKTRKGKEKSPKIQRRQNEFRNDHNQTMFKKRSSEYGASRCGFHGPLLRPGQCMLWRQIGYRASECPTKKQRSHQAASDKQCAFGTFALGCDVFDVVARGAEKGFAGALVASHNQKLDNAAREASSASPFRMTPGATFRFRSRKVAWHQGHHSPAAFLSSSSSSAEAPLQQPLWSGQRHTSPNLVASRTRLQATIRRDAVWHPSEPVHRQPV